LPSENTADFLPSIKQDRIIRRWGGRHLIFRTKTGGIWLLPKPYVLISSFRGPIWLFYGVGQIWVTHRRLKEIDSWLARVPRFVSTALIRILDFIEADLRKFISYCNEAGIEGTIVMERQCLEFHWTFGHDLDKEKHKPAHADRVDEKFHDLVAAFLNAKRQLSL
jgi:hypothetical protein